MQFRPLHDRVLVRRVEQEAKTTGGIIIPDTAQEKPMEGEVIAVGRSWRGRHGSPARCQGRRSRPLRQVVRNRGQDRWRGADIMKESDVMGIVDSGAAAGNKS